MSDKAAYCFGYGYGGHFLRDESGHIVERDPWFASFPWDVGLLDGGLLNNRKVPDHPDTSFQPSYFNSPDLRTRIRLDRLTSSRFELVEDATG